MKVKEITVMVEVSAPDVRPEDKKWSEVFESVAKKLVSPESQSYVCWQIDNEVIDYSQKVRMQNYILKLLGYDTLIGWAWDNTPVHAQRLPSSEQYTLYRSLWCKRLAKQFRKAGL